MNVFLNLVFVKMAELVRTSAGVTNVTVQKEMPVTTVMEVSLSLSLSLSLSPLNKLNACYLICLFI